MLHALPSLGLRMSRILWALIAFREVWRYSYRLLAAQSGWFWYPERGSICESEVVFVGSLVMVTSFQGTSVLKQPLQTLAHWVHFLLPFLSTSLSPRP